MSNPNAHIRRTIKALLTKRGMSAELLAYEAGVSKGYMYGYLKGGPKHNNIGILTLQKLAKGLEVSLKDLLPDD
jgi:transcriptional regulator with XRE-family HTH domain